MTDVADPRLDLRQWQKRIASEPGAYSEQLVTAARELRRALGNTKGDQWWKALGLDVRRHPMAYSGSLLTSDPTILIAVNANETLQAQRFTVAHELAHALLDQVAPEELGNAEAACDSFASELLLPRHAITRALTQTGGLAQPQELLRLARYYDVSLQLAMRALQQSWRDRHRAVVVLERRPTRAAGKTDRPSQQDDPRWEFALSAGSPFARPAGKPSVQSMGFSNLLHTKITAERGPVHGVDVISYRYLADRLTEERSGSVSGVCRWSTYPLSEARCVALLDLSSCQVRPSRRRPPTAPVSEVGSGGPVDVEA